MDLTELQKKVDAFEHSLDEWDYLSDSARQELKEIFSREINAGRGIVKAVMEVERYCDQQETKLNILDYCSQVVTIFKSIADRLHHATDMLREESESQKLVRIRFIPVIHEVENDDRTPLSGMPRKYTKTLGFSVRGESVATVLETIDKKMQEMRSALHHIDESIQSISPDTLSLQSKQSTHLTVGEVFEHDVYEQFWVPIQSMYDMVFALNQVTNEQEIKDLLTKEEKKGYIQETDLESLSLYKRQNLHDDMRWAHFMSDDDFLYTSFEDDRVIINDLLNNILSAKEKRRGHSYTVLIRGIRKRITEFLQ